LRIGRLISTTTIDGSGSFRPSAASTGESISLVARMSGGVSPQRVRGRKGRAPGTAVQVLGRAREPAEDYADRLAAYLATVSEINQSDLAAYVSRRRTVLDLLGRLIRADKEGKYSREDAIHSLIVPMRTESNELASDGSNLWIIDERLAFHDYLASDKTLRSMPVTGSESTKEPPVEGFQHSSRPTPRQPRSDLRPLPEIAHWQRWRGNRLPQHPARDSRSRPMATRDRQRPGSVMSPLHHAERLLSCPNRCCLPPTAYRASSTSRRVHDLWWSPPSSSSIRRSTSSSASWGEGTSELAV
jgi:hypothetical protein